MIKKFYGVDCDFCGSVIDYCPGIRPTKEYIESTGAVVIGRKHFCCQNCADNYMHDLTVARVGNLKQFAPGKKFKR